MGRGRGREYAEREHRRPPAAERRATTAALASPRLLVGAANDPAEQEADRFADGLIADLQRRPSNLFRAAQTPADDPLGDTEVDPSVQTRIAAARGGGTGLSTSMRTAVEAHAGVDLGHVRVHRGREAGILSRSLQATAFTVGHDVFLGDDAPGLGSAAGDRVLAHELAHVVQSTGATVRRLFPSKKPKPGSEVFGTSGAQEMANGLSKAEKAERAAGNEESRKRVKQLQRDIAPLESALKKILALPDPMEDDDVNLAMEVSGRAEKILAALPAGTQVRARRLLGVTLPAERGRLQKVVDEIELKTNRTRIVKSKAKAEQIYLEAGRNAAPPIGPPGKRGFQKLSGMARDIGFANEQTTPADAKAASRVRGAGARLKLTPAQTAAILTFTAPDYGYMNPATANDDVWMATSRSDELAQPAVPAAPRGKRAKKLQQQEQQAQAAARQQQLRTLKEEGALHAGMAVQGLNQLEVWTGPVFRGEAVSKQEFDDLFTDVSPGGDKQRFVAKAETRTRLAIASQSKSESSAEYFMTKLARPALKGPARYQVLYITELTNGRDIEELSTNPLEKEVATLPGATFAVESVEVHGSVPGADGHLIVRCKQTS